MNKKTRREMYEELAQEQMMRQYAEASKKMQQQENLYERWMKQLGPYLDDPKEALNRSEHMDELLKWLQQTHAPEREETLDEILGVTDD
jgi:hypothetical protein